MVFKIYSQRVVLPDNNNLRVTGIVVISDSVLDGILQKPTSRVTSTEN